LLLTIWCTSGSPLFPYTTLFRSLSSYSVPFTDDVAAGSLLVCSIARSYTSDSGDIPLVGISDDAGNTWRYVGLRSTGTSSTVIGDRKSTRLNSSHVKISYAVFCL